MTIGEIPLPVDSLLHRAATGPGTYTDCFETVVDLNSPREQAFARFVFLFFDSRLFRLERAILKIAWRAPATRDTARALALTEVDRFAVWHVDGRTSDELLLRVPGTPILTWLAIVQTGSEVRLRFGSAILVKDDAPAPSWGFRVTKGAHRVYSKLLLRAARADWVRGKHLPD